ncbi:pickpocket protein 28-like [Musca domestica]|uniref:Pickpocket protein 28-like n=1 Tax=Musca domestica TaxID=7370 RepID=A0A1I8N7J9_MUSDO|nr:pickpocket protein 28-like [Musca domestica]
MKASSQRRKETTDATGSHDAVIAPEPSPGIKERKSLKKNLKEIYEEFCSNTSIHGFQYFGQQRPRSEIIFWIIVIIVTLFCCISIIVKVYVKWHETPEIVTFSEQSTPVWNIPFPRLTICPETKRALKKNDSSYVELVQSLYSYIDDDSFQFFPNFTRSEHENTLTLMHVCQTEEFGTFFSKPADRNPIDYLKNLNDLLPGFERYFLTCQWFGRSMSCEKLLTKVYTDEGICYAFNSLKANDLYRDQVMRSQMREESPNKSEDALAWSLEKGYAVDSDFQTYPMRALSSGSKAGFQIFLQSFPNETDFTCTGPTQGFKIMLNSPDDVPSVEKHFVWVPMDRDIMVAVKPTMITTSADVKAYRPEKRRCYFQQDRQLRFYKIYTQRNCERECVTNFTYHKCGCVKFSMPRTADMPICGEHKILCYQNARNTLLWQQFKEGLSHSKRVRGCNCMPGCTSLEYETEISEGSFDLENTLRAYDDYDRYFELYPGGRMSLVTIYFKDNQFITSRRSELYGVTELMANFGGVLGLFMGVSLLSVVEIMYHCSLRLWSNVRRGEEKGN